MVRLLLKCRMGGAAGAAAFADPRPVFRVGWMEEQSSSHFAACLPPLSPFQQPTTTQQQHTAPFPTFFRTRRPKPFRYCHSPYTASLQSRQAVHHRNHGRSYMHFLSRHFTRHTASARHQHQHRNHRKQSQPATANTMSLPSRPATRRRRNRCCSASGRRRRRTWASWTSRARAGQSSSPRSTRSRRARSGAGRCSRRSRARCRASRTRASPTTRSATSTTRSTS